MVPMVRVDRMRRKAGSFALEAAVALPGFVLVATLLLTGMMVARIGIQVDMALERLGRLVGLAGPAADFVGVDRLDGVLDSIAGGDLRASLDGIGLEAIADLLVSGSSSLLLPSVFDVEYEAVESLGGFEGLLFVGQGASRWRIECESRLSEDTLRITVIYSLRTPFGPIERRSTALLPLWASGDGTRDPRSAENVWNLGNLERGRALRARFGGNLPMGYPVLSAFREGTATVVHSMDLSERGWQDLGEAERDLMERVEALATFDGTPLPWGSDGIAIAPGSIRTRRFILVVPTNTDVVRSDPLLERCSRSASDQGVLLSVVRYQESLSAVAEE